jgi:Colicin E5 ribonuclease domain
VVVRARWHNRDIVDLGKNKGVGSRLTSEPLQNDSRPLCFFECYAIGQNSILVHNTNGAPNEPRFPGRAPDPVRGRPAGQPGFNPPATPPLQIPPKIARQMPTRGWTQAQINEAIATGEQIPAVNYANGNPATRYVHPTTGQSVVVDNVTGQVIQVGGPGFLFR